MRTVIEAILAIVLLPELVEGRLPSSVPLLPLVPVLEEFPYVLFDRTAPVAELVTFVYL